MKKRFLLFDIDNTLYNTSSLRGKLFDSIQDVLHAHDIKGFEALCEEIYRDLVRKTGIFYPDDLVKELKKALPEKRIPEQKLLDAMYNEELLSPHLYDETHELIAEFEHMGELGIFSQGMQRFQKLKVKKIANYFKNHHTHIVTSKIAHLPVLLEKYKDHAIYFLDDALPILHAAKKADPTMFTIWVKRGRHALVQEPIPGFTPDATVLNLKEAERIIKENSAKQNTVLK